MEAVDSLSALAFVHESDVDGIFKEIKNRLKYDDPKRRIFTYFNENYVGYEWGHVRYPVSFWSCYNRLLQDIPRTTNHVEGWHFRMNNFFDGSNPSTWKFFSLFIQNNNIGKLKLTKLGR